MDSSGSGPGEISFLDNWMSGEWISLKDKSKEPSLLIHIDLFSLNMLDHM